MELDWVDGRRGVGQMEEMIVGFGPRLWYRFMQTCGNRIMARVFFSHVEDDSSAVEHLAEGLEKLGHEAWFYERDGLPGVPYPRQVREAADGSDLVILVVSKNAIRSRQVHAEVVYAFEQGRPFLPLLIGISHIQFQRFAPEWRFMCCDATSIKIHRAPTESEITKVDRGVRMLTRGRVEVVRASFTRHGLFDASRLFLALVLVGILVGAWWWTTRDSGCRPVPPTESRSPRLDLTTEGGARNRVSGLPPTEDVGVGEEYLGGTRRVASTETYSQSPLLDIVSADAERKKMLEMESVHWREAYFREYQKNRLLEERLSRGEEHPSGGL